MTEASGAAHTSKARLTRQPPPDLASKLRRALWNLAWRGFFRPSPVALHGWRRFLLRRFGACIGAGAHVYPSARIWAPWNLSMGDGSCLAPGVDCYCVGRIVLGERALVSQRAFLCGATHDCDDPDFALLSGAIVIGAAAWVAAEAFVGPGVVIGGHAVVGARTVVRRDVDPWTIVVGDPAVPVRKRRR